MAEPHPRLARVPVQVSRATHADMPAIVAIENLSFADNVISRILIPCRADLVKAGVPMHDWPDYPSRVLQCQRTLLSNEIVLKAESARDGEILGSAFYDPGIPRADRTWSEWIWHGWIYPILDKLGYGIKPEGVDTKFFALFRGEMERTRKLLMKDRTYATLEILTVHPKSQGHGVGSALLKQCTDLADASGLPIILESSDVAVPVYERHGFKKISQSNLEYKGTQLSWPVMLREPKA